MKVEQLYTGAFGLAALGVLGVIAWLYLKGPAAAAKQTVQLAGNVVGGAVVGAGELVGIPETDKTECEKALAEGRTWDASFACPAGTWLKHLVSPATLPAPSYSTVNSVAYPPCNCIVAPCPC